MSLEQAIQNLADAINAHAAALTGKATTAVGGGAAAPKADAKPEKAKTDAKAKTAAPAAGEGTTTDVLDYETAVKPVALRVNKEKGRDALVAILGKFGVSRADEVPAEKRGEFVAACESALA